MKDKGKARITWLGHSAFRLVTETGKIILIDPWIEGNPATPASKKKVDGADAILVTHGHFDHLGETVALAKTHSAAVVANWEISVWLEGKGVENVTGMNKGGTVEVAGVKVTMTSADHSSGILDDGRIVSGGDAAGYVIELSNGYRIYHAGDTNLFSDMALVREFFSPDVAMLPIGGHFTMGPRQAARACQLVGAASVIPMHFGTFPILEGTPAELREATRGVSGLEIIEPAPGESW